MACHWNTMESSKLVTLTERVIVLLLEEDFSSQQNLLQSFIWDTLYRYITTSTCINKFIPVVVVDGRKALAQDHSHCRRELNRNLLRGEEKLQLASDEQRVRRKNIQHAPPADTSFKFSRCDRDCHSGIGLHRHNRRCSSAN